MHDTLDPSEREHRVGGVADWSVRRKVALVLAVPLLLAVALGGLRVGAALLDSRQATSTADQVTVLRPAVSVLSSAEDAAMVFRDTDDEAQRQAALTRVRGAVADLMSAARAADLADSQRAQVDALVVDTEAIQDGSALRTIPSSVDALDRLRDRVNVDLAGGIDVTPEVEGTLALVGEANDGRLALTQQQLLVLQRPSVLPKADLFAQLGIESAALANLVQSLPEDSTVSLLDGYNSSNKGLVGIGTPELEGAPAARLYDKLSADLLDDLEGSLADSAGASQWTAIITAALVLVALLAAVILALVISRALVNPIRKVRDGALAVANEQLPETVARIRAGQQPGTPETIDVTTTEEMGQLARAVDDLHLTAVRLAQDEAELRSRVADMFVTLSRRSTSLVNQQLHLIDRLERDEEDPARLESLFRLDHLASRMRRTTESLVVLADAPTQRSEQDALTVTEAVHAATAGVQDYQRVTVEPTPRLRINGSAAADVVHLLTELVDNALSFSPPTTPVVVTTTAPSGMVLIEIRDAGLGIAADAMAQINQELRSGGELSAEAARRMGLLVVSRLARRHGITVLLEDNVDGGVTAQVFLPRPLVNGPDIDTEFAPSDESDEHGGPVGADGTEPVPVTGTAPPTLTAVPSLDGVEHDHPAPTLQSVPSPAAAPPAEDRVTPAREPVRPPTPAPTGGPDRPTGLAGQPPGAAPSGGSPGDALAAVINANIRHDRPAAPDPTPPPALPRRAVAPSGPEDRIVPDVAESTGEERAPQDSAQPGDEPLDPATSAPAASPQRPTSEANGVVNGHRTGREDQAQPRTGQEPVNGTVNGAVRDTVADEPRPSALSERRQFVDPNDDDTPLFRALRSSWFDGDQPRGASWGPTEADAGWQAADRARESAPTQVTSSGLPMRNPGNRLVPGGVSRTAAPVRRDPEAIRARLAAHAAGVARGRSASGTSSPTPARTSTENEE